MIEEVDKNDIGVLISSHNLVDLEKLCDTITIVEDGKILSHACLDDLMGELTKLQVVFSKGIKDKDLNIPNILKVSNVGSVYTLIVDGYEKVTEELLKSKGATLIEEIDITLEEAFIALAERKDRG